MLLSKMRISTWKWWTYFQTFPYENLSISTFQYYQGACPMPFLSSVQSSKHVTSNKIKFHWQKLVDVCGKLYVRNGKSPCFKGKSSVNRWFVVWNMFYVSMYWECNHPKWFSYFSEGWLNHQPANIAMENYHFNYKSSCLRRKLYKITIFDR